MTAFLFYCIRPLSPPVLLRVEAESEDDAFYEAVIRHGLIHPRLYGYIENPRRGSVTRA